jgi:hypothetical protein
MVRFITAAAVILGMVITPAARAATLRGRVVRRSFVLHHHPSLNSFRRGSFSPD